MSCCVICREHLTEGARELSDDIASAILGVCGPCWIAATGHGYAWHPAMRAAVIALRGLAVEVLALRRAREAREARGTAA